MTTVVDPAIRLSEEQIRHYNEEGWLLVRGLIPRDLLEGPRQALLALETGEHDWPAEHCHYVDPAAVRDAKGNKLPGGLQLPAKRSPAFAAICDHARLVAAMSQVLGGPVTRFTDQAALKTKLIDNEQGSRSYYHQDSSYWKLNPRLGCNCWIPFDEVGKDAIALAVMPRSQRDWTVVPHESYFDEPAYFGAHAVKPFPRLRIPSAQIDFSKEVLVPMQPGDGLFFTNYTWHRSEPNRTGISKSFYAIAYRLKQA
ncbi:MAG: phytanoyl-CoA dioxygenase family protein [Planctomycetota bacterium]|nr:phytanoyl-CoA dioxygenase family protein [Planctomycetota bacterium]